MPLRLGVYAKQQTPEIQNGGREPFASHLCGFLQSFDPFDSLSSGGSCAPSGGGLKTLLQVDPLGFSTKYSAGNIFTLSIPPPNEGVLGQHGTQGT